MKGMDFADILEVIAESAKSRKTVKIYYPKTENTPGGWREVEPYSFATDVGKEGEHLVYGSETITPGHIFNAFTVGSKSRHCSSFILGKIRKAKEGDYEFKPKWKIEI